MNTSTVPSVLIIVLMWLGAIVPQPSSQAADTDTDKKSASQIRREAREKEREEKSKKPGGQQKGLPAVAPAPPPLSVKKGPANITLPEGTTANPAIIPAQSAGTARFCQIIRNATEGGYVKESKSLPDEGKALKQHSTIVEDVENSITYKITTWVADVSDSGDGGTLVPCLRIMKVISGRLSVTMTDMGLHGMPNSCHDLSKELPPMHGGQLKEMVVGVGTRWIQTAGFTNKDADLVMARWDQIYNDAKDRVMELIQIQTVVSSPKVTSAP